MCDDEQTTHVGADAVASSIYKDMKCIWSVLLGMSAPPYTLLCPWCSKQRRQSLEGRL